MEYSQPAADIGVGLERCPPASAAPAPSAGPAVIALPPLSPPLPALFVTSCPSILPPDLQAIASLVSSSCSCSRSSSSASCSLSPPPALVARRKRPLPLGPVAQANLYRDRLQSAAPLSAFSSAADVSQAHVPVSAAVRVQAAAQAAQFTADSPSAAAPRAHAAHPRKKRRSHSQGELQVRMALM